MCQFEEKSEPMTLENCNLFKRSITTEGIGYTFNNEREEKFIKNKYRSLFSHNKERNPTFMRSTNPDDSLRAILEEVESGWKDENGNIHKPKTLAVSLHNPQEPADTKFTPSRGITIPLGYTTSFLITPKVTEIDHSGKELTESQRNCRLNQDSDSLNIFNIYTRTACLFECMMRQATERCGCIPWDFPVNMNDKVRIIRKGAKNSIKNRYKVFLSAVYAFTFIIFCF